jgi:hypothetical protein
LGSKTIFGSLGLSIGKALENGFLYSSGGSDIIYKKAIDFGGNPKNRSKVLEAEIPRGSRRYPFFGIRQNPNFLGRYWENWEGFTFILIGI